MNLYDRDYNKEPSKEELKEYKRILELEKSGLKIGYINHYREYPEAIRHHNSLFPNNHIDLFDWQVDMKMSSINSSFEKLVHNISTNERDILRFINKTPAPYIIGSLLQYETFGHHATFIFPEFSIEDGKYYADYLIVGRSSGGYEFLFVELESVNGTTTLKSGYDGKSIRAGYNQIFDWKYSIESNYNLITNEFKKNMNPSKELPTEFIKFDSSRFHYAVVSGLRKDYNETTYRNRRIKYKEMGIRSYHYDNLLELAIELENRNTF